MKKKIIFGILLTLFIGINLSHTFQLVNEKYSIELMIKNASAQLEGGGEPIYFRDFVVESGLCNQCLDGVQASCSCTRYCLYCISGGSDYCDHYCDIDIDQYNCELLGAPCF